MDKKKQSRLRRARKIRGKIRKMRVMRLSVNRTPRHIYVQLIDPKGAVLAQASTLDKEIAAEKNYSGNQEAAKKVGALIAKRALEKGIKSVAFDRSGFYYHGRVKALAEAARKGGLEF